MELRVRLNVGLNVECACDDDRVYTLGPGVLVDGSENRSFFKILPPGMVLAGGWYCPGAGLAMSVNLPALTEVVFSNRFLDVPKGTCLCATTTR